MRCILHSSRVLDPKCQKDTKRFFEKLGSKEELLSFLYDWYSALDEREIGEMVDEIERFGTDSEQKKIDDIIKRIHKRSNCDMTIDMIRKMIKDKEKRDEAEVLYQTYGKAQMARQLEVLTQSEFMEINHMTVYFMNTDREYIRNCNRNYREGKALT